MQEHLDFARRITVAIPSTASGAFPITSGSFSEDDVPGQTPLAGSGAYTPPSMTLTLESADPNQLFGLSLSGTVSADGSQLTLADEDMITWAFTHQ